MREVYCFHGVYGQPPFQSAIIIRLYPIFINSYMMRALPGFFVMTQALADVGESNDYGLALHGFKAVLAQADNSGCDGSRRPDIKYQHVVFFMVNDFVQGRNKISVTAFSKPALKDGKLQPFTIALHKIEDGAPAFWVADIVSDNIQALIHGLSTRGKVGVAVQFSQQVSTKQPRLNLEQAPVAYFVGK